MEKGRTLIYVDEFEPVACGRRDEPFYVLGREDLARFGVALERAQVREAGSAVGYYRSHNRNGMFLAPEDVRLIHAHFSAPDNLFLLVKTLRNQACTAGFFFWKDGHLQSEFTDSEAPLIPVSLSTSGASLAEPAPEELPAIALPPLQKAAQRRRWIAPLLAAGVAAAVTVGVIAYRPSRPSPSTRAVANPQIASQAAPAAPPPVQAPAPAPARSAAKLPQAAPAEHRRAPAVPFRGELRLPLPEDVLQPALAIPPAAATGAPAAPTTPRFLADTAIVPVTAPPAPPPETRVPTASKPPAAAAPSSFVGPQVTHQATPAVPREVRTMLTADVQLNVEVSIDAAGKVTDARLASSHGSFAGLLTIEALKAARVFRFRPAQENGRNVPSVMTLTFRFGANSPVNKE